MQAPLFAKENKVDGEKLEQVYVELLEKAKILYPDKTFILGSGNENADVVVVGESPGPPDIATGKPFTGPAGDLLIRILGSIGLRSSDCFLTNVIKFISTGDEINAEMVAFFTPFLRREIAAVDPQIIISLGNTPTRALLETKKPISEMRGKFFDLDGRKLLPTFNPAYLLRDASKKREVWEDMKMVREYLRTR
ncbi:MAG TPA: uracil-DNA glycosylase [Pyrinomonadaceae bacterium]|nr:uracil-DNA glycosylase [Pyrinomonadaceae bacterium]